MLTRFLFVTPKPSNALYFRCVYEASVPLDIKQAFEMYKVADYFQDVDIRSQCVILIRHNMDYSHVFQALEYDYRVLHSLLNFY